MSFSGVPLLPRGGCGRAGPWQRRSRSIQGRERGSGVTPTAIELAAGYHPTACLALAFPCRRNRNPHRCSDHPWAWALRPRTDHEPTTPAEPAWAAARRHDREPSKWKRDSASSSRVQLSGRSSMKSITPPSSRFAQVSASSSGSFGAPGRWKAAGRGRLRVCVRTPLREPEPPIPFRRDRVARLTYL